MYCKWSIQNLCLLFAFPLLDLDECTTGQYSCHPFASCVNNIGSYSCECPAGYRGPSRTVCIDIDECDDKPNLCGRNSVCKNTNGGYQCLCESGYVRRNHSCVDYDECANRDHKCRRYSSCVNTVGSYRCKCKEGFYSNGPYCVDLNECQGGHNCDVNAWCTNTSGSYRCFCKKGYRGNGMTCERRDMSYCEPGDENCQSFAGVPKLGIPWNWSGTNTSLHFLSCKYFMFLYKKCLNKARAIFIRVLHSLDNNALTGWSGCLLPSYTASNFIAKKRVIKPSQIRFNVDWARTTTERLIETLDHPAYFPNFV